MVLSSVRHRRSRGYQKSPNQGQPASRVSNPRRKQIMDETGKNELTRRGIMKAGLALAGGTAMAGLSSMEAKAAKELRIMMAGGSWKDWVSKVFAEPFAKAN